jgi:sucrose phosphorylase
MSPSVQLITYVDRLAGTLPGLTRLLTDPASPLHGLFAGVHLLPFFDPIDGADAGFDPIDHTQVDARLGSWDDVKALGERLTVMADVIVNHVSSLSPQFRDWSQRGAASPYAGLFLTLDRVFPQGASERELLTVYRPRPGLPLTPVTLASGERRILWTTFTPQQVDIDVENPQGLAYLDSVLQACARAGVKMLRLDAVGYAIKRPGTSCFMLPETFDFIDRFTERAHALGLEVLVEIHAHHRRQIEIAKRVDWVYDFALPPLVLLALGTGDPSALKRWIGMRPTNALNVLDTHDGIGIVDIGPDPADRAGFPGLVDDAALDALVEGIHRRSGGQSRKATGEAASNLDIYQVNCTFYDALGRDDAAYLAARAVQLFLPGVAQIYYVGLLAGENDMALLARSRVGRDINRHHYTPEEIDAALARPVVQDLMSLIRLRNTHPAFGGTFTLEDSAADHLVLHWAQGAAWLRLTVNCAVPGLKLEGHDGETAWRWTGAD